jgi:hypothetical protein
MFALLAARAMTGGCRWTSNSLNAAVAAFTVAVLVCFAASPWSGTPNAQQTVENYLKVLVFYLVLVSSIRDEGELKQLIWGFLLVMGAYMAHSLREYMAGRHTYKMGIVRMIAVSVNEGDPNSFAATIAYALPMVVPLWFASSSRWPRCMLAGYVGLSTTCIILTGSRTSLVLTVACVAMTFLRSRRKLRMIFYVALATSCILVFMPSELKNRFATIVNSDLGPANAKESADSRIEGFYKGLELWTRYPATGSGPGAWLPATGGKLESHNLYGQLIGELGTLGTAAFAFVLISYRSNIKWISARYRAHPEWEHDFPYLLSQAVASGVILMLIGGCFGHNLFRYSWLWYGGFLVHARRIVERRLCEQDDLVPA